jgi:hypothetical protein
MKPRLPLKLQPLTLLLPPLLPPSPLLLPPCHCQAVKLAKSAGWGVLTSHRSGETGDDFIADIAVGLSTGHIKSGAPARWVSWVFCGAAGRGARRELQLGGSLQVCQQHVRPEESLLASLLASLSACLLDTSTGEPLHAELHVCVSLFGAQTLKSFHVQGVGCNLGPEGVSENCSLPSRASTLGPFA